jgi:hypothetical protein
LKLAVEAHGGLARLNRTAQADRMIASEKSREFVSGFTPQWLGMDRLDFFQFDFKRKRNPEHLLTGLR